MRVDASGQPSSTRTDAQETIITSSSPRRRLRSHADSSTTFVPGGPDTCPRRRSTSLPPVKAGLLLRATPPCAPRPFASAAAGGAFRLTATTPPRRSVVLRSGSSLRRAQHSRTLVRLRSRPRSASWASTALAMILALAALRPHQPLLGRRFIITFWRRASASSGRTAPPSKPLVDTLFHAHRFESLLDEHLHQLDQRNTDPSPSASTSPRCPRRPRA